VLIDGQKQQQTTVMINLLKRYQPMGVTHFGVQIMPLGQ
jgi:hypothetical protein